MVEHRYRDGMLRGVDVIGGDVVEHDKPGAWGVKPWTWKQFVKAMQEDGWRLSSQQGYFEHKKSLAHYNPFNSVRNVDGDMVEAWEEWAGRHETPPPF